MMGNLIQRSQNTVTIAILLTHCFPQCHCTSASVVSSSIIGQVVEMQSGMYITGSSMNIVKPKVGTKLTSIDVIMCLIVCSYERIITT